MITGSWPIDTEHGERLRARACAALASSVHLVCRPRENPDGSLQDEVGEWRDVLTELPKRIHEWMPRLAEEGVVGADAIFACLGPALEVFSRYSRVEKASGERHAAGIPGARLGGRFDRGPVDDLRGCRRRWPGARRPADGHVALDARRRQREGRDQRQRTHAAEGDEEERRQTTRIPTRAAARRRRSPVMSWSSTPPGRSPKGWASTWRRASRLSRSRATRPGCCPLSERTQYLFGKDTEAAPTGRGKKKDEGEAEDLLRGT